MHEKVKRQYDGGWRRGRKWGWGRRVGETGKGGGEEGKEGRQGRKGKDERIEGETGDRREGGVGWGEK